MSSSKFATPFFQKSPLYGAYSSGAGGMVTVSYDDVHQKFQDGIAQNVAKARAMHDKKDPCDDPNTVQYTENSVLKKCPKKTGKTTVKAIKENQRITDQATEAEFEDNMADINSTEGFLESEEKKDAAKLKQQKKSAANIISNFQGFSF